MSDDDFSLFTSEMRGVKRIQVDQADTGKVRPDRQQIQQRRHNAVVRTSDTKVDGLSDQFVIDVGAEDELYWARDGVQDSQLRKLKAGQRALRGQLPGPAWHERGEGPRDALGLLAEAARYEVRCVRVTHGKAARLDGKRPMIKSHVNTWLRQHPQVLGFTSCLPKHGGTGAVYVLLKRTMMDGRDED